MTRAINTHVAIIGGGLIGTSAALALRKRGVHVVLVERDACGAHSSGINYGGVRRQGRPPEQMPIAMLAHRVWQDLKSHIGIDGEMVVSGHLKLARTQADMDALEAYAQTVRDFDLDLQLLDTAELRRRYPWVGDEAIGGSLCPGDGHAHPRLIAPAFAAAARAAGAHILESAPATSIDQSSTGFKITTPVATIHAEVLLNCAGAWAAPVAEQFGEPVPIYVQHPTMIVTEPLPPLMTASIGVQGGGLYARQVERGNCIIGGGRGYGIDTLRTRPGTEGIQPVLERACSLFPSLRHALVIRSWSGNEAVTPDKNPIIGPSVTTPGLFHGFGFSGGGFQISPAVGEILAEMIALGQSSIPMDTFSISRFRPGHESVPRLPVG